MRKKIPFAVITGKEKKQKPGERIVYILLMVAIILLVLQATYSLGRNVLASLFVDTVSGEHGVLEHTVEVSGVLVRDERVVAAPLTGTLRWQVQEGERVALGTTVATITSAGGLEQNVTAPAPGIFIKHLDGLEGVLQPKSLAEITPQDIDVANFHLIEDGEEVQQGSMIFKLVDNYAWHLVVELPREQYEELREISQSTRLRFAFAPDEMLSGRSTLLSESDDRVTVGFALTTDIIGGFTERFAEATVIVRGTSGIVLPSSALILRGEETGVYIVDKSVVRYRSVDVLDIAGDQVAVEGIRAGSLIVTNPSLVREGQRL